MADEENNSPSKKSLPILPIVLGLLITAQTAAIGYLAMNVAQIKESSMKAVAMAKGELIEEDITGESSEDSEVVVFDPVLVEVGPVTVNLKSQANSRKNNLLYASFLFKSENQETVDLINTSLREINNSLILLLSDYSKEDIITSDGKIKLSAAIMDMMYANFLADHPEIKISNVLFSKFIVQ